MLPGNLLPIFYLGPSSLSEAPPALRAALFPLTAPGCSSWRLTPSRFLVSSMHRIKAEPTRHAPDKAQDHRVEAQRRALLLW